MFVHINPEVTALGETISTLKFAERVATIELGAAQSNKETGEIRELKEEVWFLVITRAIFKLTLANIITVSEFYRYQISNQHWRGRKLNYNNGKLGMHEMP